MVLPQCYQDFSCQINSIYDFYGSAIVSPNLIFLMLLGAISVSIYVKTKTVYFIPPMIVAIAVGLQGTFIDFNNVVGQIVTLTLIITAVAIALKIWKLKHE